MNAATPGKIPDSEIKELKAQAEALKKQVVKEQNATLSSIYKAVTGGLQDLSQITAIQESAHLRVIKRSRRRRKEIAKTFNDLFNGAITSFKDKINKVKNLDANEQKSVKAFNDAYELYQDLIDEPYDPNIPGNKKLYREDLADAQKRIFTSIRELYKLNLDGVVKEDVEEISVFARRNKTKNEVQKATSLKNKNLLLLQLLKMWSNRFNRLLRPSLKPYKHKLRRRKSSNRLLKLFSNRQSRCKSRQLKRKQVEDLVKQEEKKIETQEPVKQEVKSPVKEPSISQKAIRDSLEKRILDAESAAFRQTNPLRDRFAAPVQTEFAQVKEMLAAFDNKSLHKGQEVSLDQIRKKYEEIIRLVKEYQAAQASSEQSAAQQAEQLEKQNAEFNKQYQTLRKQALGGRSPLAGDYKAAAVAELDSLKADIDRYSKYNIPSDSTAAQIQQRIESTKELIALQRQLQNEEKSNKAG